MKENGFGENENVICALLVPSGSTFTLQYSGIFDAIVLGFLIVPGT